MKVVLHHTVSPGLRSAFEAYVGEDFTLAVVKADDTANAARELADADALLHVLTPVTAAMIAGAPRLKLIQKIGVGVDTIDLAAAAARGVSVANMPGTNSQAVAEMTLLLMLGALRRAAFFDRRTRSGEGWTLGPETFDTLGEIAGRTVGFLGYGQVARRVAPAVKALGAKVIYHNRQAKAEDPQGWRPLQEVLTTSDILSLHLPLTPETRGLINGASLARMRRGVIIVNTARGGLVDEAALAEALRTGQVAGAGLDVLAQEPAKADNPLFGLDNVMVAPHISWLTPETIARSLEVAFENCRRISRGAPLLHAISPAPL